VRASEGERGHQVRAPSDARRDDAAREKLAAVENLCDVRADS